VIIITDINNKKKISPHASKKYPKYNKIIIIIKRKKERKLMDVMKRGRKRNGLLILLFWVTHYR